MTAARDLLIRSGIESALTKLQTELCVMEHLSDAVMNMDLRDGAGPPILAGIAVHDAVLRAKECLARADAEVQRLMSDAP